MLKAFAHYSLLQMNPSATSGGSSLSPKASSPSPADPAPKPALADPESASSPTKAKPTETADPEPSAASSPTKAKPTAAAEPAEDTKAAGENLAAMGHGHCCLAGAAKACCKQSVLPASCPPRNSQHSCLGLLYCALLEQSQSSKRGRQGLSC